MQNELSKRAFAWAALGLGAALTGCNDVDITINSGEGVPLSELDLSGAAPNELVVTGGASVIVTEGDTLDIVVEGDDDVAEAFRFIRDTDTISIKRKDGWDGKGNATLRITMATPSHITISGSGTVETPRLAQDAEATIGGSGTIRIAQLDSDKLEVTIGGAGDIIASGRVKELEIDIGGSGKVKFDDVTADEANISIGGSGNIAFQSDGTVDASIGGSGEINVKGTATCSLSSFGAGTLNCAPEPSEE